MVVNFSSDVSDLVLLKAEFSGVPLGTVLSGPGCSRKLDLTTDPNVNKNKLILQASGTITGLPRKDKDTFTFRKAKN